MRKRCPYNKQPGVLLVQLNFYFIFCSVPHRVVSVQPENMTFKTPFFQIVQYIEYHCISVQGYQHLRVPVLNNFLISVLHYSHTKSEFRFWQLLDPPLVSTNRESNASRPITCLSFRTRNYQQKFDKSK